MLSLHDPYRKLQAPPPICFFLLIQSATVKRRSESELPPPPPPEEIAADVPPARASAMANIFERREGEKGLQVGQALFPM